MARIEEAEELWSSASQYRDNYVDKHRGRNLSHSWLCHERKPPTIFQKKSRCQGAILDFSLTTAASALSMDVIGLRPD